MRIIKLLCLPAAFSLLLFLGFSSMFPSITAYADDPAARYQINADAFADFYDEIPANYLGTDGEYHSTTFHIYPQLAGATSSGLCYYQNGQSFNTSGMPMMWYYCTDIIYNETTNNALWETEKVIFHLNMHLSNCSFMTFGFTGYMENANAFYNLPYAAVDHYNYCEFQVSSNSSSFPLGCYDTSYASPCRLYNNSGSGGLQSIASVNETDFYIKDIVLSATARDSSGYVWVGLYLPYVSENSVLEERGLPSEPVDPDPDWGEGQSVGEVTGTIEDDGNGTQNVNVTVTTDNTGFLAGILNGIRNLFVPSAEDLEQFSSDMQEEFSDHLGGLNDIWELLDEQADYLSAAVSTNYVYFPELEIPIDGEDYIIIEGQQVELRPANTSAGLSVLWEAVALAVDIVCVLAVLNMLQTKYEIFLNPDGEVITYDS